MGCCYSDLSSATENNVLEQTFDFTRAKIVRVIDGDTFWIVAEHNRRLTKFSMRLYGCDCLEKNTERGKEVKETVKNWLENKIVTVNVLSNKVYNGKKVKEKFGRLIGFVYIDGKNLTDLLIEKEMAKPYFGGKKD